MKILTALQDPKTNEILKEKTKHNIIETDIQYQEGIIEVLEKNNKIDLIIISELLPGNIGFKDLINKIKTINNDIEIIVILENKNYKLKEFLMQKNIKSIFYNKKVGDTLKMVYSYRNIAWIYEVRKEYVNAARYAKMGMSLLKQDSLFPVYSSLAHFLGEQEKRQGNFLHLRCRAGRHGIQDEELP